MTASVLERGRRSTDTPHFEKKSKTTCKNMSGVSSNSNNIESTRERREELTRRYAW